MTLPAIRATTRVLAVLGDPVAHSLSPLMHTAAMRAAGLEGVYVPLRCDAVGLRSLMQGLAGMGGGGNVTLPHKQRAAALLDVPSDAVRRTGACNTFWGAGGSVHGDNTDVEGFRRALAASSGGSAEGLRVLLLGAGGAARAVVVALLDDGVGELSMLNRSAERARGVAAELGQGRVRVLGSESEVRGERFDLVVNATRLGIHESDPLPIELATLEAPGAVMDLVYGRDETAFVRAARAQGVPASDGREMLVQQGAAAFERWWGEAAPVEAMRAALAEAHA